jgi:FMN phosphatase YigB (HAD superfamily)
MNRGLILDLDNTVYNWVDAFLPSFRAMTHKLADELSIPEEEILAAFSDVYKQRGTVEYPRAVDELVLWDAHQVPSEEKRRITSLVNKVFSITYRRNLSLFPHVRETLEWTQDEGILVVGLSDALEHWVCFRLRRLGVARYFSGLYTWHHDQWFEGRPTVRSSIRTLVRLASSELKPNVDVVNRMLTDFNLSRADTFMLGDSLSKDVAAARAAGVRDVWARYGTRPREENLNTLRRITPWTETEKVADREARLRIAPTFTIDDISELTALMGTRRPRLFG